MRIELASFENGKAEFDHVYEPGELSPEDERLHLTTAPRVSGLIRLEGRTLKVEGRLVAQVAVDCDRCLQTVQLPVDVRFQREYVTADDYQEQHAVELREDDLGLSIYDGEGLDIDQLVNEELVLAVPTQVLCQESCLGICPVCGGDRNKADCGCQASEIDPRWAALKELVNRKS